MPRFYLSRYRRRQVRSAPEKKSTGKSGWALRMPPLTVFTVVLGVFCLLYVWQVTLVATRGYERGSLNETRLAIEEELETLTIAMLDEQTLARVEERVRELNFVPEKQPVYVSAAELAGSVTLR